MNIKRLSILLTVVLLATIMPQTASAKRVKLDHMYMFGFSASFRDTTLFVTDIQDVNGAWYNTKTGFLEGREAYSQQLRDFLAGQGHGNRVCLVIFARTLKKAEKKYAKLMRKYVYKKNEASNIQTLDSSRFRFEAVEVASTETE